MHSQRRMKKKKTNEYSLEHWARGSASSAQPKIKKEKKAPGPEAASRKPQASSLKEDIIK